MIELCGMKQPVCSGEHYEQHVNANMRPVLTNLQRADWGCVNWYTGFVPKT